MSATDGLRLAVATFTRLPVTPPPSVDRRAAGGAMLLASPIGLLLGLAIGIAAQVLVNVTLTPALLAAVLAVGLLTWLSGGAQRDLAPFGLLTRGAVLLAGAVAFAALLDTGAGGGSLVIAVVIGRTSMMLAATRGAPSEHPDGLGATVAGSVPPWAAWLITLGWLALFAGSVGRAHGTAAGIGTAVSILAGVAVGWWVTRLAVRRFGGISGDALGATCEAATATILVLLVVT